MLAGVLTVLKIIGIVLLCMLAFLLVLILLVLFVPVRYRADALVPKTDLDEGFDIEKISASARFSWLWFVIRGGIEFPKNKEFTVRVFGIKILPRKEKKTKKEKKDNKESDKPIEAEVVTETKTETEPEAVSETAPETISKPEEEPSAENGSESETQESPEVTDTSEEEKTPEQEQESAEQEKTDQTSAEQTATEETDEKDDKSFLDVLWDIIDTVDNFLKTPLNVFEKIQYTISRVCDKIDMIKSTDENEIFPRAFDLVKRKLIKVIRMILPDKIDIDLLLGTGDPALTAEIMGAYGALYPIFFKKVRFTPDFENRVVAAKAHIKGHITVFTVIYSAAVCFFNKDVRKTIKRFKKIIDA